MTGRETALPRSDRRPVHESLREYGRGVAGGLLFSLPLLYTMEVWDAGIFIPPHRQLAYLGGTVVLLLGYNRYSGLRPETSWTEVAIDSVEELGIGLVLSAAILLALGRIGPDMQHDEVLGRIIVEAFTIAIGVSVGTAQLGGDPEARKSDDREAGVGGHLTLAACGAVLFAANVAPTEEIVVIGVELPPMQLAGLGLLSLLIGCLVLFFSDFRGTRRRPEPASAMSMVRGTIITYAVALVCSGLILWLFGRFDQVSAAVVVGQTIALAVAGTLGASAGKLLLQQ